MSNTTPAFQTFRAIDWSGAKGSRLGGLQMSQCHPGDDCPQLIRPATQRYWTRASLWQDLVAQAHVAGPVLAAFDMGLGLPFVDRNTYFPGWQEAPITARQLWRTIDRHADCAPDFYGGLACQPPSPLAPYFNAPGHRGPLFDINRCRRTEEVCRRWTRPSSVFNGVGAGSVGIGSLAGMRLLHTVRAARTVRVRVWPFDRDMADADIVIVEMFPRLYALLAGANPQSWREAEFLPHVLRHYHVQDPIHAQASTEDEVDALFSAAAIRQLATDPQTWSPTGMTDRAARYEGWIFGCTAAGDRG